MQSKQVVTLMARGQDGIVDAAIAYMAPDFALVHASGQLIRLSSYRGKKQVVLVFNRGFG